METNNPQDSAEWLGLNPWGADSMSWDTFNVLTAGDLILLIPNAYRMHAQSEFLVSSAVSDPRVRWTGRARAAASTRIETVAPSRRAARGQQRSPP